MLAVFDPSGTSNRLRALAVQLAVPVISADTEIANFAFLVVDDGAGLSIQAQGPGAPGPVNAEFAAGKADYRRRSGAGEMIVKAIGGCGTHLAVIDATAGLGRDSFILACHGYRVTMLERSALVVALLQDGLNRASLHGSAELRDIIARMQLHHVDAIAYLQVLQGAEKAGVVYLDPMFPPSGKSALVKKEMRLFQQLLEDGVDEQKLLDAARSAAIHRVVVKRPVKAAPLAARTPSFAVTGKAVRYDVYALKSFKK